uniref:protein-tyrosine-phosphatase n=1 Tax=Petromyzon marinus TaxID=7757 RepID=A0AAJ7TFG4_PETMA|nr:receptor-type tyrosine-protein phosphatase O-like isoform X1 [Petromyzon marinus]
MNLTNVISLSDDVASADGESGSLVGLGSSGWVRVKSGGQSPPSLLLAVHSPGAGDVAGSADAVLPVVVALALVGALLSACVFLRLRRAKHPRGYGSGSAVTLSVANGDGKLPFTKGRSFGRRKKHKHPVPMSEFGQNVLAMSRDSGYKFTVEFEELRMIGAEFSHEAADHLANRGKNRYTNILPYDFSRVILSSIEGEEGSDYINANYIPGHRSPKEYIAAQGPLPSTCDDFWRMVWEQNSRVVVMLTQCVERGRIKCEHYWPFDEEVVDYRGFVVRRISESALAEWTVREFQIGRGGETRVVRQFHYTAWPDHDVPSESCTRRVLEFVRTVRCHVTPGSAPIVVHCSAGVGRTGTFIALDRLIQHLQELDFVDILGLVAELRLHRASMVQTEVQYVFIHLCVLEMWRQSGQASGLSEAVYENVRSGALLHPPDVIY